MARAFHGCTVSHDAFPVIGCIGFGTRAAMPNVQPSAARLKSGEVIRFDVGGRYKHYRADIARMAVLGEADDKTATYVRALHVGVLKALEMIRPGVKASAVFETAVEAVRREGIPHYNRSHVGHGIGVDGYDLPDLTPASKDVIEEGMVMCVETPLLRARLGGPAGRRHDRRPQRWHRIADDQRRRPEGDAMTVAELPRALLREDLAERQRQGCARRSAIGTMADAQRTDWRADMCRPTWPSFPSVTRSISCCFASVTQNPVRSPIPAIPRRGCRARQRRAGRPAGLSGVSRRRTRCRGIEITGYWRPDSVAFLLGCSNSMDDVLLEARIPQRHLESEDGRISVYTSDIMCAPAGIFRGPVVVTMRPIPQNRMVDAIAITARYPMAHGAPVHVGDPRAIGIDDLSRVGWGKYNELRHDDVPVFWACGVTPQAGRRQSPHPRDDHACGRTHVRLRPEAHAARARHTMTGA
jgi:hypothetical protein